MCIRDRSCNVLVLPYLLTLCRSQSIRCHIWRNVDCRGKDWLETNNILWAYAWWYIDLLIACCISCNGLVNIRLRVMPTQQIRCIQYYHVMITRILWANASGWKQQLSIKTSNRFVLELCSVFYIPWASLHLYIFRFKHMLVS